MALVLLAPATTRVPSLTVAPALTATPPVAAPVGICTVTIWLSTWVADRRTTKIIGKNHKMNSKKFTPRRPNVSQVLPKNCIVSRDGGPLASWLVCKLDTVRDRNIET